MAKRAAEKKKPVVKAKGKAVAKKVGKAVGKAGARVPRAGKADAKRMGGRKRNADPDYKWVARKFQDSDPYFALDHSVSFLTDLFNQLIQSNQATLQQVERFIAETNHSVTLEQILQHFGVARA